MFRNLGVGSWMARRAAMTPDRVALGHEERRITYGQLDERVTRLARALARRGIREGDRVGFLGPNHPAALETLFACGLLGAIAVPIHPGFDDAALSQVLAIAGPAALIVTPERLAAARRSRVPRVFTIGLVGEAAERYEDLVAEGSDEPIDRAIGLDHTCLLAFSSGTTGPNKGVALTHGNVLFNVMNTLASVDALRDDVILTSAPLYRMGGLGFTLAVLFKGGTAVLQERPGAEASLRLVEEHRVTILFDAVFALEALQAAPSFATADLSSLRVCITGGSPVPPRLVEAFRRRGLRLVAGYGLTEAAPLALMQDGDEVDAHPGAAGRPVFFGAVRVVDADLEDVPAGVVGELLIQGPNVTPGYFRDPGATSAAFTDGWLRTGDAARADRDGTITVVGRVSEALVLGGRLVHPGPIEQDLCERSDVADAAIVQAAPEDAPIVCVVPAAPDVVDPDELAEMCRARLGGELAPEIRVVAALPKNPNGKVVRAALRAAATDSTVASTRAHTTAAHIPG